ncbi:hypothetical protein BKA93DRAFT_883062 [Sparassis latifolia]
MTCWKTVSSLIEVCSPIPLFVALSYYLLTVACRFSFVYCSLPSVDTAFFVPTRLLLPSL